MNTAHWIALTYEGEIMSVNMNNVRDINRTRHGGSCLNYSDTHWREVEETPEQIIDLINGSSHNEKEMD